MNHITERIVRLVEVTLCAEYIECCNMHIVVSTTMAPVTSYKVPPVQLMFGTKLALLLSNADRVMCSRSQMRSEIACHLCM